MAGSLPTWIAVAAAVAVVFALGVVGFSRYQQAAGAVDPITTRLYLSLQLFVLQSGSVPGPLPWELDVARFAAPIVGGYALLRVLAAALHEQVDLLRLRSVRDHLVVVGLGRMGTLLAQSVLDRGGRVVAIEIDAANPELATVRAMGGLVVVGDARSPAILQRAGVDRARQLVAVCGDDGTNIEVIDRARGLAGGHRVASLHCVAHVVDPDLGLLLCAETLKRYGDARVRVDFVNVHAAAAQALLGAHPPFGPRDDPAQRVAVIGAGRTAQHVLLALARAWAGRGRRDGRRVAVTVLGPDAGSLEAERKRHPEVERFADVQVATDLGGLAGGAGLGVVYVCPDGDGAAAAAALELRVLLAGQPTRIVVVLEARSGLGRLLDETPQPAGGPSLVTFGLLDEACREESLLTGMTETLARALHGAYLDAAVAGEVPDGEGQDDPALRPWQDLPETLRESNRDQAAHVATKLAAVGQGIAPLADWDAAQRPFREADVETMSRLEHDRWVAERQRAGWRPGPRDAALRTTPYLVPWEQLSAEVRDKDRLFVRQLPRLLASAGLQVVRSEDPSSSVDARHAVDDESLALVTDEDVV